jgi:hypothetical protein
MSERIEIDGEQWEIRETRTDIWVGRGAEPHNRGCIVSAHNRDALVKGIPGAREKHRMGAIAIGMEAAIVTAFKDVIKSNMAHGWRGSEHYAERQQKFAQLKMICADLWPWIFDERTARDLATPEAGSREDVA